MSKILQNVMGQLYTYSLKIIPKEQLLSAIEDNSTKKCYYHKERMLIQLQQNLFNGNFNSIPLLLIGQ